MSLHLTKHGAGMPLVFFHGWGFDSQIWNSLIPLLAHKVQLILVDLPGFGASHPMDWSLFCASLLEQLPQRFALVGWSMGGLYATELAIQQPLRVKALFNVASSPRFIKADDWPGVTQTVFEQFYHNLAADRQATLNEFIALQMPKKNAVVYNGSLPSLTALKAGLDVLAHWDLRSQLAHVSIPVSYMFGRLDRIVPVDTLHIMQQHYSRFNYLFLHQAGHMPFLSHPELFAKELLGFIL
ncbi:MAG: alpha/beta fold hydrolase [Legionella sp.]